ncbi:MAG: sulfatase-like hydrolase/transferase [Planctomycetes bacterium]|nr:sulfatase-like hydrolase/transferase [Planctomycetota bacterium]
MMMDKQPNILWVSFEDTNPFYGCYGDAVARTPNVDRLAAEGCIWPNAFAVAGVCAPARSAVITGMYPTSIGSHHMRTVHQNPAAPELPTPYGACPPAYVKCFPEYFRAAGYYCSNNEKTDYQFDAPSTAWDDCSDQGHWRNRPDPEQPFFAVFNPCESHESGMWEEKEYFDHYDLDTIELPPYFPDTKKVRESMARMYTNIEKVDAYFGELLDQLEEDGLADNTIVVHWSDHGPMPRGKRWPYDSGIHVPMVIRWPEHLQGGTICDQLVSTIDLGPCMMSCCGIDIPQYMQGQAFLGETAAPARDFVFAARDRYDESYDMIRAARTDRFKYMRHYMPMNPYLQWIPYRNRHPIMQEMWRVHLAGEANEAQDCMFKPRPSEELYDCHEDPHELNNLANDPEYAEQLSTLRCAVDDWMIETNDMGHISESEMVAKWYPNGERPTTAAPLFIPINAEIGGQLPAESQQELKGPCYVQLYSATQGASLSYTLDEGDEATWHLYSQPILLSAGKHKIRARSVRIGYFESEVTQCNLNVL